MTSKAKATRRQLIVRRVAARKSSETWARRRREKQGAEVDEDSAGVPETDAALDDLPESLVG